MEVYVIRSLYLMPLVGFAFLTCGAEAQVRYPISRVVASTDVSAALLYRRSACFQKRVSLLADVPAQQFYLRLLTPWGCLPQPF
jgi:hypothetical protein